jgi:hypothetical protein
MIMRREGEIICKTAEKKQGSGPQDFPHFSLLVWGNRLQTNDLLVLTSGQAGISIVLPKVQGNLAFGSTRHRAITRSAAHSIAYFPQFLSLWHPRKSSAGLRLACK